MSYLVYLVYPTYLTKLTNRGYDACAMEVTVETTALSEMDFSSAKSGLSTVMDEVVHSHQPRLVKRHRGKERMLLVRPEDLARWLDTFGFDLAVTFGEEGDVTVAARGVGVLGFGDSLDEAMRDLADELAAYARRFFANAEFYARTDRAHHYPALLRFALQRDRDEQLALLYGDAETASRRRRGEVVASAG